MKWQLRLVKNAVIGVLPLGVQRVARRVKRGLFPHPLELEAWMLEQGLRQVEMLRSAGFDPENSSWAEIGAGWAPVIPLVFHFAGARSLTLIDIQRLMDDHTFRETCRQLATRAELIGRRLNRDPGKVEQTLVRLSGLSLEQGLAEIGCTYLAPCNLLDGKMAPGQFDIISSRAVIEHMPPQVVQGIFAAAARLLRAGGVMCHIIDNSDHWEHNDKSISRLNFLKYGPRTFAIISAFNRLDYQNRLRHSQYLRMMREAGFEIAYDASPPDIQALCDLGGMKLAPMFRSRPDVDLAVLTTNVVARKAEPAVEVAVAPPVDSAAAESAADDYACANHKSKATR